MKINPLEWNEVPHEQEIQARSGVVQLRGSGPFSVLLSTAGVTSVQFVASEATLRLPEETSFKVIPSQKGVVVFVKDAPNRVVRMTGEKFTNIDRLPQESQAMQEVTKAVRMMRLEERAMVRRIRDERDLALREVAEAKARQEAVIEPEPEPEPKEGDE